MYLCDDPLICRILAPLYEWHSVEDVLDRLMDTQTEEIMDNFKEMRKIIEEIIQERIQAKKEIVL